MSAALGPQWTFPFGAPLLPAKAQRTTGRVTAFVVGVYSSAVHARWISAEGKQLCQALAVASEPYSFWDGSDADAQVAAIAKTVPETAGRLQAAPANFNGPSGRALDRNYLEPLQLARSACWITDLHDLYFLSPGNAEVLSGLYASAAKKHSLPTASLPARPASVEPTAEELQRLKAEFVEATPEWVITLGNEPIAPIFGSRAPRLALGQYGEPFHAEVFGRRVKALALCHPRQAARLGTSSKEWYSAHQQWERSVAARGLSGLAARL